MIKLLSEGKIDRDQKVVCVLTGIGLKTLEAYSGTFPEPVTIKPIESEIERIASKS
jgi:threonine synthase